MHRSTNLQTHLTAGVEMGERDRQFLRRCAQATPRELRRDMPSPTLALPASPPAVLVDLHRDQRLSLAGLLAGIGGELASSYSVSRLLPGSVTLTPVADGGDLIELRVDARSRLRLSRGVMGRLGVAVGGQVLVLADGAALQLFNLALVGLAANAAATDVAASTSRLMTDAALGADTTRLENHDD